MVFLVAAHRLSWQRHQPPCRSAILCSTHSWSCRNETRCCRRWRRCCVPHRVQRRVHGAALGGGGGRLVVAGIGLLVSSARWQSWQDSRQSRFLRHSISDPARLGLGNLALSHCSARVGTLAPYPHCSVTQPHALSMAMHDDFSASQHHELPGVAKRATLHH